MAADPSLSERELEILRLVATGVSNKEIATQLGISPNTVKVHLRNIFSKIGAPTRTAATLYALENGLAIAPALETAPPPSPAPEPPAQPSLPPPQTAPAQPRPWLLTTAALLVLGLIAAFYALPALAGRAPLAGASPPASATPRPAALQRWKQQPPAPSTLSGMSAAAYEGSIYLIGGADSHGPTAAALRFDPALAAWQTLAPRPVAATDAPAAVLGEKIYLPGGLGANGLPLDRLDVYDPRADGWETRAPLPVPLSGAALAAFEGRLYLFGGFDGSRPRGEVYAYDPQRDAWSLAARLPAPLAYAAAVPLEGKVLLVGGERGGSALRAVLAFYPQRAADGENPWEQRASLPAPRPRAAAASLAGIVYLAGGESPGQPPLLEYQPQQDAWQALGGGPALGLSPVLVPLDTRLHLIGAQEHWSYQAIYTLLVPLP